MFMLFLWLFLQLLECLEFLTSPLGIAVVSGLCCYWWILALLEMPSLMAAFGATLLATSYYVWSERMGA